MGFKFNYKASTLNSGLQKMGEKVGVVLLMYCSTKAVEIESKMKSGRPWTDRTGQAKATLNTKVSKYGHSVVRITAAHGVDYGIWLELANEKNFAIIAPTIQQQAPLLIADLNDIMSQLK